MKKILIIGGGLSGIYLGYLLKKEGFYIKILEANNRIGGRIYTKINYNTTVELGATWLWRYNTELIKLCRDLNISIVEQNMSGEALYEANNINLPQRFKLPKNQEISYRITGGTTTILNKLATDFSEEELLLNQKVLKIENNFEITKIVTENNEYNADFVISTIPPLLLVNSVYFSPKLDENLIQIANNTHTWMKDSIKFAVIFKTPFWKEKGLSGAGFSNIGPFTELYDHSDVKNKTFALMGFLNGTLAIENEKVREKKVANQLFKFFGEEGKNYIAYEEKIWNNEPLLNSKSNQFISPHFNNGNQIYQQEFLNGKFIIAGAETSPSYGGYMEGAIFRGNQIAENLKNKFIN